MEAKQHVGETPYVICKALDSVEQKAECRDDSNLWPKQRSTPGEVISAEI